MKYQNVHYVLAPILILLLSGCGQNGGDEPSSETPCGCEISAGTDTVTTLQGTIKGTRSEDAYAFLGIPFAAPPIGALRWHPPQPPACRETTLNASSFQSACPQLSFDSTGDSGTYEGEEDCLYLNVFKPVTPLGDKLPVMVFIHGGGNTQGSAAKISNDARIYDGSYLAGGDAVVVTLNYRLGALGWLVHPALEQNGTAGNLGLQDQAAALQWVRDNAAAFGGNPDRVMLFGQSGGAVDVCALLSSEKTAGLFDRAAMQSGGCVAESYATRLEEGEDFVSEMNCSAAPDIRECLMQKTPRELVSTLSPPLSGGVAGSDFGLTVDGVWLTQYPDTALETGDYNHVPLLIGSNRDETALSILPGSVTPTSFERFLKLVVPSEMWDEALSLYPPGESNAEARASKIAFTTDSQFTCAARRYAKTVSGHGDPVWRYLFTHTSDTIGGSFYGAFHGLELFYLFQTYTQAIPADSISDGDRVTAGLMGEYWRRFAATGDPNGGGDPFWPSYDAQNDAFFEINADASAGQEYRKTYCDFWDRMTKIR